jgi:hypothetical protein
MGGSYMKRTKKLFGVLCLTIALSMFAPGILPNTTGITAVQAASKVKLNKTKVTLHVGETAKLKVTGTSKKVTWKSSKMNSCNLL